MVKNLSITLDSPLRVDRVVQQLTGLSRAGVRGLIDHDCVRINRAPAAAAQQMLQPGDVVEVHYDPHTRLREHPRVKDDPAYHILFEDEHLLVVDKAARVLTVPTESGKGKTLVDALERYVNRDRPASKRRQLHVVHRLDHGVSGVLVIARNAGIARKLKDQFAAHKPQRIYVAVVNGIVKNKQGTFRSHLATDGALNRFSTRKPGAGELAVTHYQAISHSAGATVVRVQLETGRRNQIRVHFAEAGHPVLGDTRYPRDAPPRIEPRKQRGKPLEQVATMSSHHPKWKARRLALHAMSLEFEHPATCQILRFEAILPAEFGPFVTGSPRGSLIA